MNKKFFIIPIIILFACKAQKTVENNGFCKDRKVCIKEFEVRSLEYAYQSGAYTDILHQINYQKSKDKITISANYSEKPLSFYTSFIQILDSVLEFRDPLTNLWRVDSLRTDGVKRHYEIYFNWFRAYPYVSTLYGKEQSVQSKRYYTYGGDDSLLIQFNSVGILRKEVNYVKGTTVEFWPSGVVKERKMDTLILGNEVLKKEKFYENGMQSSLSFYHKDTACLTWLYFNESGNEIRRIEERKLYASEPKPKYEKNQIYVDVFTDASYIGGHYKLEEFFKKWFEEKKVLKKMAGDYQFDLRIDKEGYAKFAGMDSTYSIKNIENIRKACSVFKSTRMFRPAKIRWDDVASAYRIKLVISK